MLCRSLAVSVPRISRSSVPPRISRSSVPHIARSWRKPAVFTMTTSSLTSSTTPLRPLHVLPPWAHTKPRFNARHTAASSSSIHISTRSCRQYFERRGGRGAQEWHMRRLAASIGGVGAVAVVYYYTHLEDVPLVKPPRRRFIMVSSAQEADIGRAVYEGTINEYRYRILPRYHPHAKLVAKVAGDIIRVAGLERDADWEINVIDAPVVNAFVLPGGKVFVFTGILDVSENEDGLATVLGHEISHQIARHSAERLSWANLIMGVRYALRLLGVDTNVLMNPALLTIGLALPFSRKCETEADYMGLMLMAEACYDPREAVRFWKRMKNVHRGMGTQFLSTHPNPANRIDKLREWMPEAVRKYETAGCADGGVFDGFWSKSGGALQPRAFVSKGAAVRGDRDRQDEDRSW